MYIKERYVYLGFGGGIESRTHVTAQIHRRAACNLFKRAS
jgi:CRISPR/Cas system CSM-associated protein Csm5 (group 7 of RAMP superfamily)